MPISNSYGLVIASGQTLSNSIQIGNLEVPIAIEFPSELTAATFYIKAGRTTPKRVYRDGAIFVASGVADTFQNLDPTLLLGAKVVQIESTVAQGNARTFVLITAEL